MTTKSIRIIAVSDTHSMHDQLTQDELPQADIFIHAGDFTMESQVEQLQDFKEFVRNLPYKNKIVIPGNHQYIFNPDSAKNTFKQHLANNLKQEDIERQREDFKQICKFLQFELIQVEGIRILGISKDSYYFDWNFDFIKQQGIPIIEKYKNKVDILVTHYPPFGILDKVGKQNCGSKGLLEFVQQIKPKIHIFGHIHEGYGQCQEYGIKFINASSVNKRYQLVNKPYLIQLYIDSAVQ